MRKITVDYQRLEDFIVEAFKSYERGRWPFHMRYEARNIINASEVQDDD